MKFSPADSRVRMRFYDVSASNSVLIFRVCWWFCNTKTEDWCPTVRCVYHHLAGRGKECDRMVSGRSEKTVAVDLCCLLLVVESLSWIVFMCTVWQFVVL